MGIVYNCNEFEGLLDIGKDITKVWLDLTNINRHDRELDFFNEITKSFFVNTLLNTEVLLSDFGPQYIPVINKIKRQVALDQSYRWTILFLQSADHYPLHVNLVKVTIIEQLFTLSNQYRLPDELTPLIQNFIRSIIEELAHLLSEFKDELLEEARAQKEFVKLFLITPSQKNLYPPGLAFSLRQLPVGSVRGFLDHHHELYEGDFIALIKGLLLDYPHLLMDKTIEGINLWLRINQEVRRKKQLAVLRKSINEIFPFSSDITHIRAEVKTVCQRLKGDQAIRKYLQNALLEKEALYQQFKDDKMLEEARQAKFSLYLDRIWHKSYELEETLKTLETKPYDIYPKVIELVETAYFLGNRNDEAYHSIYRKSVIRKECFSSAFQTDILPRQGLEKKQALEAFYLKWIGDPMKSGDSGFELYFAYALRQMKKSKIASFLNHQLKVCQQALEPLLLSIFQDYKTVLQNGTVRTAREWMEKNKTRLEDQKTKIEKQRLKVPDSYFKIDTGLSYDEIIECFSFLYREQDEKGNSFLSKADFDQVFRFGLAMPNDLPSSAPHALYLDKSNFSRGVIYHFLHKFAEHVESRKRRSCPALRKGLARFLVCYFQNFRIEGESEERLINKVRRQINSSKSLPKKSALIEADEYLSID
jgi:hypothetical protein